MKDTIFKRLFKVNRRFTKNGTPIVEKVRAGMLLARKTEDGVVEFGYCSVHPADTYSDAEAFRLSMITEENPPKELMPTRVRKAFPRFVERAKRYFVDGAFYIKEAGE